MSAEISSSNLLSEERFRKPYPNITAVVDYSMMYQHGEGDDLVNRPFLVCIVPRVFIVPLGHVIDVIQAT